MTPTQPPAAAAAGLDQLLQAVLGPEVASARPTGREAVVRASRQHQPHKPYPPGASATRPVQQPRPPQEPPPPHAVAAAGLAHPLRAVLGPVTAAARPTGGGIVVYMPHLRHPYEPHRSATAAARLVKWLRLPKKPIAVAACQAHPPGAVLEPVGSTGGAAAV
jgi:hypothetical protein